VHGNKPNGWQRLQLRILERECSSNNFIEMQILFISEEAEVIKFLSGLQAVAMMPLGPFEVSGMSEDTTVTVVCTGTSAHYQGTITKISNGFLTESADGKWLGARFMVRRINSMIDYDFERTVLND
jgi:hypothetical protein